jgi:hypothetical protein
MVFCLSKVLRAVCYLWLACALFIMSMPLIGLVLHRYDGLYPIYIGFFVSLFALAFYFLSRCKTAKQPTGHPVIAGILWSAAVVFGLTGIDLLYCCLFA